MRLWHKDLIPCLPRQQLLGQWRECCLIAKTISKKGTPNHLLVNKIMDYPLEHFWRYSYEVCHEMEERGYKCNWDKIDKYIFAPGHIPKYDEMFEGWHNDRYLIQCYYNLQEKYDCGGFTMFDGGDKILKLMLKKGLIV